METNRKDFNCFGGEAYSMHCFIRRACITMHRESPIPFLQGAHSYFGIILQKNVLAQIQKTVTRTGSRTRHSFTKHF